MLLCEFCMRPAVNLIQFYLRVCVWETVCWKLAQFLFLVQAVAPHTFFFSSSFEFTCSECSPASQRDWKMTIWNYKLCNANSFVWHKMCRFTIMCTGHYVNADFRIKDILVGCVNLLQSSSHIKCISRLLLLLCPALALIWYDWLLMCVHITFI